ncbi:MAG: hypothetical protein QHH19_03230 [Candidatus Thermoplasmatota archaeon]|nr:hypothetical protein [Candidatus Thermoplasmatota archaeon]
MLRRKISKNGLSKIFTKKKPSFLGYSLSVFPSSRHVLKVNKIRKFPSINLRWVFLLVSIYVVLGLFILFMQQFFEFIKDIFVYSLMGFFTFFMSYFGWRLAQIVGEFVKKGVKKEHFEYQL